MLHNPEISELFRNPATGELKKNFVFITDNGPGSSPSSILVKMCLIRLFKVLNLDSICQVSYAEYHSKRNPVERVHAGENKALSRHGPFVVDTKILKPGSTDHEAAMESMLQEVSDCLRTAQFNKEQLITMRGANKNSNAFNDEHELKRFLALNEDQKELFEGTYILEQNEMTQELSVIWNFDEFYESQFITDYLAVTDNSFSNKYTFKITNPEKDYIRRSKIQPIPDYLKYFKNSELHYLDYQATSNFLKFSENESFETDYGMFIPSRILDMCYKIAKSPPKHILVTIALLAWVPVEHVDEYFKGKEQEEAKLLQKDQETLNWMNHELYKKTKKDLKKECKNYSLSTEGTKVEIIKRIAEHKNINFVGEIYSGDLNSIPSTLSGIASLHIAMIRTILAFHTINIFGSKEELTLGLFMLKHQPDIVYKSEVDGLIDLIKICQHVISIQYQQEISSVDRGRMFPANNRTTTRLKTLNYNIEVPMIEQPAHVTSTTMEKLFEPLQDYIKECTSINTTTKPFQSNEGMTAVGSIIRIKWLKSEVNGSGWKPGWYSATVISYDKTNDEIIVEYLQEKGYEYSMNFTEMVSKGFIEPSGPLLARLEIYEKITTVGQQVEVKLDKNDLQGTDNIPGWFPGYVISVDKEDDTIEVKFIEDMIDNQIIEVSPAVGHTLGLKK